MLRDNERHSSPKPLPWHHEFITDERIHTNSELVDNFLIAEGVDISFATRLEPDARTAYLIRELIGDIDLASTEKQITDNDTQLYKDIGLVVVKPEIYPYVDNILNYFETIGIDARRMNHVDPTKQMWMEMYGYMLSKYSDVINIYITHRALGFEPIVFAHPRSYSSSDQVGIDKDREFDSVFCGEVQPGFDGTLRGSIALPAMQSLGFDNMTGYAKSFDPVNYFHDVPSIIYKAFNGVHIPSDQNEKIRNMRTLIDGQSK
ncbi:MAG TPA: hypothetical protein VF281_00905 [Candidatus Saccharimonadales bacterium]